MTAGPSDESPTAVARTGVAAHICAAAPGGRRYVPSMSARERSHIDNAIWLCADHGALIDRDSVTYTAEVLRAMKRDHEAACARAHNSGSRPNALTADLIAIGPDIVCLGDIVGIDESQWRLHLKHFIIGDTGALIAFIDRFKTSSTVDRYLLVNAIGDGRALAAAPSLTKDETGYVATCPVKRRSSRIEAASLPTDLALSPEHDLMLKGGDLATVSGVAALPQKLRTALSFQKGDSPFDADFGTRLGEYYELFRKSPWLGRLMKLEVIRQAAIPYSDSLTNHEYTPLLCVERVHSVEVLADAPQDSWLPVHVALDVKGLGRSEHDILIFIPQDPSAPRSAVA